MKKIFISIMLYTVWTLSSFSATESEDSALLTEKPNPVRNLSLGQLNTLPAYAHKTALVCIGLDSRGNCAQFFWDIVDTNNRKTVIGRVWAQYFSQGGESMPTPQGFLQFICG